MMKKQVSLVINKSIKVIVCLFLIDLVVGGIHRYAFYQQKSGKFYRINYTMDKTVDELLVFGSSHAAAHYVPDVFEKELGLSCYNAGVAGQQILVHEALQEIVLQRTTPKIMILDIDIEGFYEDKSQYDRLADLHPFYYKHADVIGKIIALKSNLTKYFLKSKLYQYNSTIVHVLRYWLAPQKDQKGYRATFVQLPRPAQIVKAKEEYQKPPKRRAGHYDMNMLAALEKFISNAKTANIPLIFIISPNLEYTNSRVDDAVKKINSIADRYDIKLFSFTNSPAFIGRYELFADAGHLNDTGARIFSKMVADKINNEFAGLRIQ